MFLKSITPLLAASLILFATGCDDNAADDIALPDGDPVETTPANTSYQPAFPEQTRVASMTTETTLDITTLTDDLVNPWGITQLPDGKFLITEKAGTMRIVTSTGVVSNAITGIPAVNAAGQGGLLGLAIDPSFTSNRMVYFSFSENNNGTTLTAVGKGRLADNEASIENASVIYRAQPVTKTNSTLHYGSRLVFDSQGNLIVSTGERSNTDTRPESQNLNSGLGKIVRITTDGQPASGNPFSGTADAQPEIYSYGHRNVQGLAIHPETGDLWENELGPLGGDEINRIESGKNYGWPTITYGLEYSGQKIGEGITQKDGLEQPVYYWDPVISPSGMTFYSSDVISEWKNDLFIGTLSGKHVVRLKLDGNKVVGEERLFGGEGQRFRDIIQGQDGALYMVTDGENGRLYRVGVKAQ